MNSHFVKYSRNRMSSLCHMHTATHASGVKASLAVQGPLSLDPLKQPDTSHSVHLVPANISTIFQTFHLQSKTSHLQAQVSRDAVLHDTHT